MRVEMVDSGRTGWRWIKTGCPFSVNITSSPGLLSPPFASSNEIERVQDVAGGCFITLVALSTLVNSVIIVQFLVKRKYKMSHHMTYLNLAVADLCISVYGTVIRGPGEYYLKT